MEDIKQPLEEESIQEESKPVEDKQAETMEDIREQAYKYENPYSNNKKMSIEDMVNPNTPLNNFYMTHARHDPYFNFALGLEVDDEKLGKMVRELPPELQLHIVNLYGRGNMHVSHGEKEEACDELISKKSLFNTYEYANRDLGIRETNAKPKLTAGMKDADIFRSFKSALGGSRVVNVPLYHSGFRIMITAPTIVELTTLQLQCLSEETEIGRDTFCLSSNSRRSIMVETFKDYILTKIKSTTLDIDLDKEDVFKYISMADFDTILLGLIQATYVNKVPVTRSCYNVINPDKFCDYAITADLDPSKLLNVDRRFIDFEMVKTIGKKEPNSVSLAEQENYVMMLNKAIDKIRDRKSTVQFGDVLIELQIPTVFDYCQDSSNWVEKVNKEIDELLDKSTDVSRRTAMDSLTIASNVTSYLANIKNIGIIGEDGTVQKAGEGNRHKLMSVIDSVSSNYGISSELPLHAVDYVNKSYIAMVATPNFICPNCKKDQEDAISSKEDFDAFIPLHMIDFFLRLVEWQRSLTLIHTKA